MPSLILIVDDQPQNLDVLVNYLAVSGMQLAVATSGQEALDIAQESLPNLILLDVMMPGLDGYAVCERLKASETTRNIPVIFTTALSDTTSQLQGFRAGAVDYISKPLQREEVLARINTHLTLARQQQALAEQNRQLEILNAELQEQIDRREQAEVALHKVGETLSAITRQEGEKWGIDAFVGQSSAVSHLMQEVRDLQQAEQTNVLVLGESGTGKELVSRAIHYGSPRSHKPFVAVNCSAIPAELADAEFFGHTKGAYTGATSERIGYFEKADGGTLFLDEIGDMPLALQAKLLRVLEDNLVTPVGGRQARKVNVRVVAATNVDMRERIRDKSFRQDLYFRLAGYCVSIPPLRDRLADIPLLTRHFLDTFSRQMGRESTSIHPYALTMLGRYHFPGNVRELRNMVEYALIASRGQTINIHHLHFLEPMEASGVATDGTTPEAGSPEPVTPFITAHKSDEETLLQYAQQHGRIDNTLAQQLLSVDHSRASYLLKKLHKDGRLQKQGERRWAHYIPA